MKEFAGSFDIEGSVKVRRHEAPKATIRQSYAVAKQLAKELSFEDDAHCLATFGKFLERIRERADYDTLPPVAVVRAYRTFIRMY
jgi:hypothetical protein